MKRVRLLFVPSLSGCLLVASLLSSCTGIRGSVSMPTAGEPQPDVSGTEPPPPSRVQVGVASWYGKQFHGRPTASGERYDMYKPTAAHLTAPLGTYAMVTNLTNGQAVRVRINDRGPHKRHRILDLSYEAARQLDCVRSGSARVKVEFFDDGIPPLAPVMSRQETMPVDIVESQPGTIHVLNNPGTQPFEVQAGAYQNHANALRAQHTLTAVHPHVWISMAPESTQPLHRVRLGPFNDRTEAERVVHEVKERGYEAVIVAMAR